MGNEFGHPEWIDFPRHGNNWSYQYARRQWHLADDLNLKYGFLARFDKDMIVLTKKYRILQSDNLHLCFIHEDDKVIAFFRAGLLIVFGFHPDKSYEHYLVDAPPGKYQLIFNTDDRIYGGHHRLTEDQVHFTRPGGTATHSRDLLSLYIPTRTAIVLKKI
jgi:1,4-alpha-glucan branching enzyme